MSSFRPFPVLRGFTAEPSANQPSPRTPAAIQSGSSRAERDRGAVLFRGTVRSPPRASALSRSDQGAPTSGVQRTTGPDAPVTFPRLIVQQFRIPGFHPGDTGATPVGATTLARSSRSRIAPSQGADAGAIPARAATFPARVVRNRTRRLAMAEIGVRLPARAPPVHGVTAAQRPFKPSCQGANPCGPTTFGHSSLYPVPLIRAGTSP